MTPLETILTLIDAVCGIVICIRLVLFRKNGYRYRPVASLLAYMIVIASAAIPLFAAFGARNQPDVATVFLHIVLAVAVVATRGNVVDLFRTSSADNAVERFLHGGQHHA